jgi:3-methyladenine DNA glycosylase AlkD
MSWTDRDLIDFIQERFKAVADPEKAGPMAAYMKTEMPFYGIQKPERIPIYKEMKANFRPTSRSQYEKGVRALWKLRHREEKYAAIEYAKQHPEFVRAASLPLYRDLVIEGAWWDLVDDIAINLVGHAYLADRDTMRDTIEEWIDDDDMWIRRTAIICHNHHRKETDSRQLFAHCLRRAHEKEFFIRKAIGWALREYSYANPDAVRDFLVKNRSKLSTLSFNEGSKRLSKQGLEVCT